MKVLVTQLSPTFCDPMDCSPPGFPVHGILQIRVLEWVAMPSSRGNSPNSESEPTGRQCSPKQQAWLSQKVKHSLKMDSYVGFLWSVLQNINIDSSNRRELLSAESCTSLGFYYFSLFLLINVKWELTIALSFFFKNDLHTRWVTSLANLFNCNWYLFTFSSYRVNRHVILSLVDGCRLFVYIERKTFSQIFFLHCYLLPISYSFPSYMVFIVFHEALNLYGS